MFTCTVCGYQGPYTDKTCPVCQASVTFTEGELAARLAAVRGDLLKRDAEAYLENCRVLSDAGYTEGTLRLGKLKEHVGALAEAAEIYRRGMPHELPCVLRYAEVKAAADADEALFFRRYAALMGSGEGALAAATAYVGRAQPHEAVLFYRMAAPDSVEACRYLARHYAEAEQTRPLAKWYLARVPHAILSMTGVWLTLRRTEEREPPCVSPKVLDDLALDLLYEAERRGEREIYALLCERLFSHGRVEWQAPLAKLLLAGDGCRQDIDRGLSLLHELAERGDTAAAIRLGDLYRKGAPIPVDSRRAMRYYETAGEFGDGRGYERLADMYRAPTDGTPPQIDRAISLYERAAAIGSADAARKLHALKTQRESYYLRAMTERAASPKDAYRHFVAAADMGYALAAVRIGDCYLGGIGVTADPRRAYLWYARAAKDGVNEAFYPLALCYARGVGTPFNYREALTWLRRAHAIGCAPALEEATRLLGARKKKKERALHACVCELLYQGKGEAALPMAELSASFGDGKAIYTLAAMAEFGIGMPADGARARELYEKAAARGFIDERATYKRILLRQINDAQ